MPNRIVRCGSAKLEFIARGKALRWSCSARIDAIFLYAARRTGCPLRIKVHISQCNRHIRFTPESGHVQRPGACPLSADFVAEVGDDRLWRLVRTS